MEQTAKLTNGGSQRLINSLERESEPPMKLKHEDTEVNVEGLPQEGRVNIGVTFPRWKALKRDKCFQTDAELACFLLDR